MGWDGPNSKKLYFLISISIHPPRMGWDSSALCFPFPSIYFNPPTPYGVGRHHLSDQPRDYRFQSTHPAWGGTHDREGVRNPVNFNPPTPHGVGQNALQSYAEADVLISIHPPRMGWDYRGCCGFVRVKDFNPPTPHGVGQASGFTKTNLINFNPPTPHGVGLQMLNNDVSIKAISIHPPRMGWDLRA